tara:strand:- start:984 stop:1136 length:153 start_codon:yes stop_codon:yes gene_type:complete
MVGSEQQKWTKVKAKVVSEWLKQKGWVSSQVNGREEINEQPVLVPVTYHG